MTELDKRVEKFEQWSSTALYIAGGLLAFSVLLYLIGIPWGFLSYINLIAVGDIIAIAGVLSLYPRLSAEAPTITLNGAICLGIAALCFLMNQVVMLGNNLFQLQEFIIPVYFIWLNYVSFLAGFLLFGVATLRNDCFTDQLGYAMLTLAALTTLAVILFALRGLGSVPPVISYMIISIHALLYFTMGYILRHRHALQKAEMVTD